MRVCRKILSLAAAMIALTATFVAAAPSSGALTNVYQIQNRITQNGKLCLDADANHPGAGGRVNLQRCNSNNAQKWQFGQLCGWNIMINVGHPGYALAATGLAYGSPLTLHKASCTDKTENWQTDVLYNDNGVIYNQHQNYDVIAPNACVAGSRMYIRKYAHINGAQSWVLHRLS